MSFWGEKTYKLVSSYLFIKDKSNFSSEVSILFKIKSILNFGSIFKKVAMSSELKLKSNKQTFSPVFWAISQATLTAIEVLPTPPLFEKTQIVFAFFGLMLFFSSVIFLMADSRMFGIKGFKRNSLAPSFKVLATSSELIS